jgi:uncharacterized protein (DUF1697 family)
MAALGKHAALLRGINVGGNNKLPVKELAGLFGKAGCRDVQTYIQSGNVVFSADAALAKKIPALMHAAILKAHKLDVPVVVRSAAELAKVAAKHPLMTAKAEPKYLHVAFLAGVPTPAQIASLDPQRSPLDPQRSPLDRWVVQGKDIYIYYGGGAAKTKFNNQYIDSRLKTVSTLRNWNTVQKLKEMTV